MKIILIVLFLSACGGGQASQADIDEANAALVTIQPASCLSYVGPCK